MTPDVLPSPSSVLLHSIVFESAVDAVIACDENGCVLDCNPAALALFACTREDFLGTTPIDWSPEYQPDGRASAEAVAETFARLEEGHPVRFDWRNVRRDGTPLDVDVTVRAARSRDSTIIVVISREISPASRLAAELRHAEARFATAFRDGVDPMMIVEAGTGIIRTVNPAFCQTFGYLEADCVGVTTLELGIWKHPEERAPLLATMLRDRRVLNYEIELNTRAGPSLTALSSATSIEFEDKTYWLIQLRDITERKRTEAALRESEAELQFLIQHSPVPTLIATPPPEGRTLMLNHRFTELFGYVVADIPNLAAWWPRVYPDPDYRAAMQTRCEQAMQRALAAGRSSLEAPALSEMTCKDGSTRFVEVNLTQHPTKCLVVFNDVTERKRAADTIWRQANFDLLTGLPNRQLFHDRLNQEMKKAQRTGETLAVLFIDLDHFKEVNDTRGHALGDRLLAEAARRIGACVRESDTLARLGGDEFTVILPGLQDTRRIDRVTQCILHTLQEPFLLGGEQAFVSGSIGIALYPDDAPDIETLLKQSDQAMYQAKTAGRNGYCYFVAAMQDAAQHRQRLIRDLRGALAAGQLFLHYQPIVELTTGRVFKAEALLRWRHPELGLISPLDFIPLAEETGLIHDIGDWVFRETARCAKRWQDAQGDHTPVQISLNKSPRQFINGHDGSTWIAYLDEIGLAPRCVVVEITEGLLLDARPEVTEKLLRFRDCGIQISLDDFGTGYSAMGYLKKFAIDYLKIDKSFVHDMATDAGDQAIVDAIIVMAHKLGLKVIAEGVETPEQRDRLLTAGCDFAQGYLFARPLPEADFEAFTRARMRERVLEG